jgi:Tol biopolymer transport system component
MTRMARLLVLVIIFSSAGVSARTLLMHALAEEGVRAELARLEKQTGLTLAWYDRGFRFVSFENRSVINGKELYFGATKSGAISRDGTEIAVQFDYTGNLRGPSLAILRPDGSHFQEHSEISGPVEICWSNDKSTLAMRVLGKPSTPDPALQILSLDSRVTKQVDVRADVTSQCWSPDGKRIVYQADNSVRTYEVGKDQSSIRILAKGTQPTWSPDGNWIAFLDQDTYYAVRPSGDERKMLFHKKGAVSGLFWSPDSRIVAYVSQAGLLEGVITVDMEMYRLRVRRLSDDSEDWVADRAPGRAQYQWVTGSLLDQH